MSAPIAAPSAPGYGGGDLGNGLRAKPGEGIQPFFLSEYDNSYRSPSYSLADSENLPRLTTQIGDPRSSSNAGWDEVEAILRQRGVNSKTAARAVVLEITADSRNPTNQTARIISSGAESSLPADGNPLPVIASYLKPIGTAIFDAFIGNPHDLLDSANSAVSMALFGTSAKTNSWSSIGKAADQGATTGDIVNGGFQRITRYVWEDIGNGIRNGDANQVASALGEVTTVVGGAVLGNRYGSIRISGRASVAANEGWVSASSAAGTANIAKYAELKSYYASLDTGYVPLSDRYQLTIVGWRGNPVFRETEGMHPYLSTGHVTVSLDGGNVFKGFGPRKPGGMTDESFMAAIQSREDFPGILYNDSKVVKEIVTGVYGDRIEAFRLDVKVSPGQYERFQGQFNNGVEGLGYRFPDRQARYSYPGGGTASVYDFREIGICNCAQYPTMLGLRMPDETGRMQYFMPAFRQAGAQRWTVQ